MDLSKTFCVNAPLFPEIRMPKLIDYGQRAENFTALNEVFDCCGGFSAVAVRLGLTRQTVRKWIECPASYAVILEELTGGQVTRYRLRPDIFKREGKEQARHGTQAKPRESHEGKEGSGTPKAKGRHTASRS
jgi:DNA-binding transcriptional regulator YdaS (Cro superfamily)